MAHRHKAEATLDCELLAYSVNKLRQHHRAVYEDTVAASRELSHLTPLSRTRTPPTHARTPPASTRSIGDLLQEGVARENGFYFRETTPRRTQRGILQDPQGIDRTSQEDLRARTPPRASSRSVTPGTQRGAHDEARWQGTRRLVAEISPRQSSRDVDYRSAGDQQSVSSIWQSALCGSSYLETNFTTHGDHAGYQPWASQNDFFAPGRPSVPPQQNQLGQSLPSAEALSIGSRVRATEDVFMGATLVVKLGTGGVVITREVQALSDQPCIGVQWDRREDGQTHPLRMLPRSIQQEVQASTPRPGSKYTEVPRNPAAMLS